MSGIIDTRHLDQSIDKLEIYSEAHKREVGMYNVANPHPAFGVDPNIKNEKGHTNYPKKVTDKDGKRVVVHSPEEEAEVTNMEIKAPEPPKDNGWS